MLYSVRRAPPAAIAALAMMALSGCSDGGPQPTAGGAEAGCLTRAYEQIGGPISLVDHEGNAVTEAAFKGEPSLVFFGFTYCPDVCPMTLVTIDQALKALPEGTEPPRTILVSIDPERDTPEALATYLSTDAFPDKITGLTGTPEQVRAAADAFIADYSRIDQPESLGEYTMSHTDLVYFMDGNWEQKTFFPSTTPPDEMARCLGEFL
ncbi:MAG: SCO family protein [Pseudomonadota bacterium]